MPATAIARRSLQDEIIARLKADIARARLRPGDRLPTEHELAARFGVSRLSIREAVRALRHLGLVESRPRVGLTVGRLDLARLGEALEFHATVSAYPDAELVRARMAVELGILPLVAEAMRADAALHGRLRALTDGARLVDDADAYLAADLAFHRALLAAARVEPLAAFAEVLEAFFARFRATTVGDAAARRAGIALHRKLLDALREGDLAAAQALTLRGFAVYERRPAGARRPHAATRSTTRGGHP